LSDNNSKVGLIDGKLRPCPKTPNCVSTQSEDKQHMIAPISYDLSLEEAKKKIIEIINSIKRTKIVNQTDNYIHAEFSTRLFKFVDDVEFLFDNAEKIIHFRSASRIGKSDLGTNRKRLENIRELYNES